MTWWIEFFTKITMTSNNDMCYPTVISIRKVRKKFKKYIEHLFFPVKISYKYIRFYRKTFSLFCWMQLKDSYKKVFQTQYAADQIPFVCFGRATIWSQRDNFIISTQMVAQEKYTAMFCALRYLPYKTYFDRFTNIISYILAISLRFARKLH